MWRHKRVISFLLFIAALMAVISLSEPALDPPKVYADSFCLLDEGRQMCGFRSLALCVKNMAGDAAECVRQIAKDKNADGESRKIGL